MQKHEYAGFWIRLLAVIIDLIVIIIPISILEVLLMIYGYQSLMYLVSLGTLMLIVWLDGTQGGTPGKLLLGLAIVNEKGKYIGIPNAILRYIGKIASRIILGIGYLMVAWDPKKQALHDRIAKTYVVYRSSLK